MNMITWLYDLYGLRLERKISELVQRSLHSSDSYSLSHQAFFKEYPCTQRRRTFGVLQELLSPP